MAINKEQVMERAKEMLNSLCLDYGFGPALVSGDPCDFRDFANDAPSWFRWSYGASRVVFWDDRDCSFVIKIPRDGEDDVQYSRAEQETYAEARNRGIEQYFAWTDKLFDYEVPDENKTIPIYAMEFAKCQSYDDPSDIFYEYYCKKYHLDSNDKEVKDSYWDSYDTEDGGTSEMLDYAESIWGEEARLEVGELIDDFGIGDLHYGNWGFCDGRLVIVDYAGYGKQCGLDYYNKNRVPA